MKRNKSVAAVKSAIATAMEIQKVDPIPDWTAYLAAAHAQAGSHY